MRVNFMDFFNLSEGYTNSDLKRAYLDKINYVETLNLQSHDKNVFLNEVDRLYMQGLKSLEKRDYYKSPQSLSFFHPFRTMDYVFNNMWMNDIHEIQNRFSNVMNRFNSSHLLENNCSSFGESKIYKEKTNEDGSITVFESSKINKNGETEEKVNTYRKTRDGNILPISYEEAMKSFEGKNEVKKLKY